MNNYPLFFLSAGMRPVLFCLVMVDLVLKGFSLYKSAQKGQKVWFVALLVINSLGVLPLIYLLIQNNSDSKSQPTAILHKTIKVVTKSKKKARK